MSTPKSSVGGQAVIEGVMMRSPRCFAVAVRRRNQAIVIREQPWKSSVAARAMKVPFVRGAFVLFESMQNGYSALRFSADQYEQDLPEDQRSSAGGDSGAASRLGVVISLLLLVALPKLLAWAVGHFVHGGLGLDDPRFHILAGFFKLAIIVGMMLSMRLNPEMYRVFQYHGAEHKSIAAHESGEALTVENARRHSTRHARCGTTFLMVVVIVSVAVFALVLPLLLPHNGGIVNVLASIVLSVPLLVPIAGISYELQRIGARYADHPIARLLLAPGYLVQGITTAEPTDDQLEVALAALRLALAREAEMSSRLSIPPTVTSMVKTFPSFAAFASEY